MVRALLHSSIPPPSRRHFQLVLARGRGAGRVPGGALARRDGRRHGRRRHAELGAQRHELRAVRKRHGLGRLLLRRRRREPERQELPRLRVRRRRRRRRAVVGIIAIIACRHHWSCCRRLSPVRRTTRSSLLGRRFVSSSSRPSPVQRRPSERVGAAIWQLLVVVKRRYSYH